VQTLLSQEIFSSTLKAKIRFPELFDLSPTQSSEKEASEAEAAKHEADAIQQAVKGQLDITETGNQKSAVNEARSKLRHEAMMNNAEISRQMN
jgi:hypothetical protein